MHSLPVADLGFSRRGYQPQRHWAWGANLLFWQFFPEKCVELKNLDWQAHVPNTPLGSANDSINHLIRYVLDIIDSHPRIVFRFKIKDERSMLDTSKYCTHVDRCLNLPLKCIPVYKYTWLSLHPCWYRCGHIASLCIELQNKTKHSVT